MGSVVVCIRHIMTEMSTVELLKLNAAGFVRNARSAQAYRASEMSTLGF